MKKIAAFILTGALAVSVCGCGGQKNEEQDLKAEISEETEKTQESEPAQMPETEPEAEPAQPEIEPETEAVQIPETEPEAEFSFADLTNLQFYFSSGAGGWGTELSIHADGSFSGEYHDSDMGSTGDGYPNGVMYKCDFNGWFTQPVKVNDYTYSMEISEMNYAMEAGKQEIIDGVLYCYEEAYGLDDAQNILIYLPGAPIAELSEDFRRWVGYYDLSTDTELSFYALNNEVHQYGFSSYDKIENVKATVSYTENESAALEHSIKNDPLTQAEYNEKTQALYELWDLALNTVWSVLKETKDSVTMEAITAEESEWITRKEQAVAEAGAAQEGGSMQAMVENQKAAEMTRERVYELLDMF